MQAKYEDGRKAQVGDAGTFVDASDGQGYLYEGAVTAISEAGRLTVEGPTPTLIMADYVIFTPSNSLCDANGREILLNDRVIVKYASKLVEGRVVMIDESQPCVKVKVGKRLHKMFRPFEVQVFAHWS